MNSKKSKYYLDVLCLVKEDKIQSTREIQKRLEKKSGKSINWFMVLKILQDLERDGRIRKFECKGGLYWQKV